MRKRADGNFCGIVNIHKEKGFTSHDVINVVRRITKCKAGHTGTLDPNATGVLPVCLGRATKIADYIMAYDKEYIAQVIFGSSTNTQDITGEVIAVSDALPIQDISIIEDSLRDLTGDITQIPPKFSAIKVGGKKLYEYARNGVDVEIKARNITIHHISIVQANLPGSVTIKVGCSKGTYIRTLCADLGEKIGNLAHMGDLVRTKSGRFSLKDSINLEQLEKYANEGKLGDVITPIEVALAHMPKIEIDKRAEKWLINGNKIPNYFVKGLEVIADEYLAFDASGSLAGIYTHIDDFIKPKVMLYTRG